MNLHSGFTRFNLLSGPINILGQVFDCWQWCKSLVIVKQTSYLQTNEKSGIVMSPSVVNNRFQLRYG